MIDKAILITKGFSLLEKYSECIFEHIKKKLKHHDKLESIDCKKAFNQYIEKAIGRYCNIKTLFNSNPIDFYDVFVESDLKYRDVTINVGCLHTMYSISNFLILEGTAGIGKSTIMNHLFLNAIYSNEFIPIIVQLRSINDSEDKLIDNIYKALYDLGFSLEKQYFEYALETGKFLILLDGFDEVVYEKQGSILTEINQISARYNNNHFVISSRHCEITAKSLTNYSVIETVPLSKEQAIELINKTPFDIVTKDKFTTTLKSSLYYEHRSFASIPLLLMIMLLTFDSYANIPNKLHIFYNQAVETLFYRHDASKEKYERKMKSQLDLEAFKDIFAKLCFITYLKREFHFTNGILIEYLDKIKKEYKYNFSNNDLIDDLLQSVCLLKIDGLNYTFTHRSFQEYFTAIYLKSLTDEQQKRIFIKADMLMYQGDNIIYMLYDMDKYRFEENYIMPRLKKYIESIHNENNLFSNMLMDIFDNVNYIFDKSDSLISRGFSRIMKEDMEKSDFLVTLLGLHQMTGEYFCLREGEVKFIKALKEGKGKLCEYTLRSDKNESMRMEISTKSIAESAKTLELFKETIYGKIIFDISSMLPKLEKEHELKNQLIEEFL